MKKLFVILFGAVSLVQCFKGVGRVDGIFIEDISSDGDDVEMISYAYEYAKNARLSDSEKDEFRRLLDACVVQDSTEGALINTAMALHVLAGRDFKIHYRNGDFEDEYEMPANIKNAFLLALSKLNIRNTAAQESAYDGAYYCYAELISSGFDMKPIRVNLNWKHQTVVSSACSFSESLAACGRGNSFVLSMGGTGYSPEVFEVLKKIIPEGLRKFEICNYEKDDPKARFLIGNYEMKTADILNKQVEFLQKIWGRTCMVTTSEKPDALLNLPKDYDGFPTSTLALELSSEKLGALYMALVRLNINAGGIGPEGIRIPNSDFIVSEPTSNPLLPLKFYIHEVGEITLYIHSGYKNLVHILGSSNKGFESVLPEKGSYFSPELYRMMLSYYAEMARPQIIENLR